MYCNVNTFVVIYGKISVQSKGVDFVYYNERMKFIRESQNLTMGDVAKRMGIKQQQYDRYEKGVNTMPVTRLQQFCEITHISADYILGLCDF